MILCVDPDPGARDATREALVDAGFDVETRGSIESARAALTDGGDVDCVVTEHDLPDGTGLELLREARATMPDASCILFTTRSLDEVDTAAFGDLVAEYVPKARPDAYGDLVDAVERGLSFRGRREYPVPDEEFARLAAVERYGVDSEALAAAFDRLTTIATALFEVDSAAVGLVDAYEERFVACHGADYESMDREETVCAYTILDDDVTVVEDVRADSRFADSEALRAAGIRFYAGAPVVAPGGEAIGVFCLHDDAPRDLSGRERELLEHLAAAATDRIALRQRVRNAERDA